MSFLRNAGEQRFKKKATLNYYHLQAGTKENSEAHLTKQRCNASTRMYKGAFFPQG